MAYLNVNGILLNSSPSEFHLGTATSAQFDVAMRAISDFSEKRSPHLIDGFMGLFERHGALFPFSISFHLFRSHRGAYRMLCETHDFFSEDRHKLDAFLGSDRRVADLGREARRILLAIYLSTSARRLCDVPEEMWAAFVATLKDEQGRWLETLGVKNSRRDAFGRFAQYMNATYPAEQGFDKPVVVPRLRSVGHKTKTKRDLISNPSEDLAKWVKVLNDYRSGPRKAKSTKASNNHFRYFVAWLRLHQNTFSSDPATFLSRHHGKPGWAEFVVNAVGEKSSATSTVNYIADMIEWFIEARAGSFEHAEGTPTAVFPLMSALERKQFDEDARGWSDVKPTQATSLALPRKWLRELQDILRGNDWAWPKSLSSQYVFVDGTRVWNPVCAYLIYTMTELPWRRIQVRSLDSGEGDSEMLDLPSGLWVRNTSIAAGYWDRDPTARRKRRGVLNREGEDFCFYVNTNKTSDAKHDFGEMSGYFVPWNYAPMIELFHNLRVWQETYNPISIPTPYLEAFANDGGAPVPKVAAHMPDRFYLFRDLGGRHSRVAPPTDNKLYGFWRLLMDELETRLRAGGEDANIILTRGRSGNPFTAHYTMHGLRVAGLTAFAEAGVPIEILSKLVAGHASVLMTIYYLKYDTAHISEVLDNARTRIEEQEAENFSRFLKNLSYEEAARIAVANEDYTLNAVAAGDISTDLFFDTGLGVCPLGGTACDTGVDLGGGRKRPVPGEAKNCLQCRYFITGEPWLVPLVLNQQKLAARAQSLSQESNDQNSELDERLAERAALVKLEGADSVPPALRRRIAALEAQIERHADDLDSLLGTMHRGHRLIEGIKQLQAMPNEDSLPALVADASVEVRGYREGTRFELVDSILQGSRVYPILRDDGLELERERFIDAVLYNNGMTPLSMMNLTKEQKQRAADAASTWLLSKVGVQETELLHKGAQTIEELGFDPFEIQARIKSASLPPPGASELK